MAGGDNLNITGVGGWFRKMGCFFIRRRFPDDAIYKLTLEAYLYHLLREGRVIEFFFEGGRSRTGKLLPPRFGLYRMLMNAHSELSKVSGKKLAFVPVSIAHEYVPESRSLDRELGGDARRGSRRCGSSDWSSSSPTASDPCTSASAGRWSARRGRGPPGGRPSSWRSSASARSAATCW